MLFLLIFNDMTDVIRHSKVIKFADDTVLQVAGKDVHIISTKLTDDLKNLSEWLTTNELIINLKKGKTETLLFGTPQKISKNVDHFSVSYNDTPVVKTSNYVYLGVKLDGSLNLNSHFEKCYKRASSRLRLLSKLRKDLDTKAATFYLSVDDNASLYILWCFIFKFDKNAKR